MAINPLRFSLPLLALLLPLGSVASPTAVTPSTPDHVILLPASRDQAIAITVSAANLNRLWVQGDPITALHAPEGRLAATHDQSGSLYVTVRGQSPFTAFLTTQGGRHYTLRFTVAEGAGRTIELLPTDGSATAAHWEQGDAYPNRLVALIKAAMTDQIPEGFGRVPLTSAQIKPIMRDHGALRLIPTAVYTGDQLAVWTYAMTNLTNHAIDFSPPDFYYHGVRAVALGTNGLAAHQTTTLITITDRNGSEVTDGK